MEASHTSNRLTVSLWKILEMDQVTGNSCFSATWYMINLFQIKLVRSSKLSVSSNLVISWVSGCAIGFNYFEHFNLLFPLYNPQLISFWNLKVNYNISAVGWFFFANMCSHLLITFTILERSPFKSRLQPVWYSSNLLWLVWSSLKKSGQVWSSLVWSG